MTIREQLRQEYETHSAFMRKMSGSRLPFYQNRPQKINYESGIVLTLERDISIPEVDTLDLVTIGYGEKFHQLNGWLPEKTFFSDVSVSMMAIKDPESEEGINYVVFFHSPELKRSQTNIYGLLHEMGHISLYMQDHPHCQGFKAEVLAWEEADRMVEKMGLTLFESDTERKLYRDLFLLTHSYKTNHKYPIEGLATKFDINQLSLLERVGLLQVLTQGRNLEELTEQLIKETECLF